MTRIAVYPGSFDPVTRGHEDIIRRSLRFVDKVIVAVAADSSKQALFSIDERVALLEGVLEADPQVEVRPFVGLLAEFARANNAPVIIRGLR